MYVLGECVIYIYYIIYIYIIEEWYTIPQLILFKCS